MHEEFPREGEHDHVEGYEGEVFAAFAVLCHVSHVRREGVGAFVGGGVGVGEEDGGVERVVFAGRHCVEGEDGEGEEEGDEPGVLHRRAFPAA